MTITKEERTRLREECKKFSKISSSTDSKITRLLDALEAAERKNTIPCPYCDFASSQRGMDRCEHCDGTGRMSFVPWLKADREEWKARAEAAETTLNTLADWCGQTCIHCPAYDSCQLNHRWNDKCVHAVLEWARQQARGGEKE